jgi:hypothetical protein
LADFFTNHYFNITKKTSSKILQHLFAGRQSGIAGYQTPLPILSPPHYRSILPVPVAIVIALLLLLGITGGITYLLLSFLKI